ncbi:MULTISPECIES: two-component system response regulator [unclassified Imperialibacter]|uniref:response regulator n=1 Tax=unclassified Imperialibacter TaxID=2629706 RepID=UPI0012565A59|nr:MULTISPECIES: response regulator [unclassified Imperialibacter]CAD5251414.1 Response regulator receiver domain-containing protein [Imperialibacter sp. 89]CAD5284561.1 Response regulator receiver domain-containing protein [Imperialibacter sp. 75]VVT11276.1 Response regulator receiver domain-containing protein [Imperialibacter sp. EC-SDR9]
MSGKKIFIIDDDDIFLVIATANLRQICGDVEIITASNGEEALKIISDTQPGVVLLDINMPVMNGWEFLEALTQLQQTNPYHIFITTSSVDPNDKKKASDHPLVRGYLEKPLNPDKIKALQIC